MHTCTLRALEAGRRQDNRGNQQSDLWLQLLGACALAGLFMATPAPTATNISTIKKKRIAASSLKSNHSIYFNL
jgi:hypothetical protein